MVSIIIPVFNAEKTIERAVLSILNQSLSEWELILVDDGSTDSTPKILNDLSKKDKRISIYHIPNSGPGAARNYALGRVHTPFVTFVDADDWVRQDYLEKLLEPFKNDNETDLVCGGYIELSKNSPRGRVHHDFNGFSPKSYITSSLFLDNIFIGLSGVLWSKMFKTERIKKKKLQLPENLRFSEDLIFVLDYVKGSQKTALVYEPLYFYDRRSEKGLSGKFNETHLAEFKKFNQLIMNKVPSSHTKELLLNRTGKQVLKLLRDQSHSAKSLKYHYTLAKKEFGEEIFNIPYDTSSRIFLTLIRMRLWKAAGLWVNVVEKIRKIKNA